MIRRVLMLFVLSAVLLAGGNAAYAKEEILLFRSDIVVNADTTLTVTETITVRAEGKDIKRGIYRDFPTRKPSIWYNHRNGFKVLSVQRGGRGEPYHLDRQPNYTRVYIGKEDVMLKTGVYTYTLKYKTTKQIRYFEDHDELYWDVNGTEWRFPIRKVEAVVRLPGSALPSGPLEAYTGLGGAKGKDYKCGQVAGKRLSYFVTTRGFLAGENISIVVPFAKNVVSEPTNAEKWASVLDDNKMLAGMLVGMLILLGYYILAWYRVGRDPKGEIIIPRFEPPEGVSAAGAGFLHRMTFDTKCVIAAIVSMAVKGRIRILEEDHGYTLQKRKKGASSRTLCPEEADARRELFSGKGKTLELKQKNHANLKDTRQAVKKTLKREYMKPFFRNNTPWFIAGLVLTGLIFAGSALLDLRFEVVFLCVWLTAWTFGAIAMLKSVSSLWKGLSSKKGFHWLGGVAGAIFFTLFTLPFLVAEIAAICMLAVVGTVWLVLIAIVIGLINLKFWFWLKQPTVEGRRLMDEIEGFKMYLSIAEGSEMQESAPMKTLEMFEEYLPYAIALGVEKQWAEQFDHLFDMDMHGGGMHGAWYSGAGLAGGCASSFASSFSSGFSGAMSSASSSGSGGGGSSGGGGGGGGGGGW